MSGSPIPVGTRDAAPTEYLFRLPSGEVVAYTFVALCDRAALRRVCGGDETWVRQSFPSTPVHHGDAGDCVRVVGWAGLDVIAAARYCISLCIDEQQRVNRSFSSVARSRRPIDDVIDWLRQWHPSWRRACRASREQRKYEASHS